MGQFRQQLKRGLEILNSEGVIGLLQKVQSKYHSYFEWHLCKYRGTRVQNVDSEEIQFSIKNKRNYIMSNIGEADRLIIKDIVREMGKEDTFFDVGSAIGTYSLSVAKHCPSANIVAFEPNPSNVDVLRKNVNLNSLDIDIQSVALSDEDGETGLNSFEQEAGGQIVQKTDTENKIKMVKGDCFVGESGNYPDVVKIDVEGAEPLVVDGFSNVFKQSENITVYCEIHRPDRGNKITDFGTTIVEFEEKLKRIGFDVETLYDPHPDWNYFIKATKSSQ
jgi:FkbM family methyltransferase